VAKVTRPWGGPGFNRVSPLRGGKLSPPSLRTQEPLRRPAAAAATAPPVDRPACGSPPYPAARARQQPRPGPTGRRGQVTPGNREQCHSGQGGTPRNVRVGSSSLNGAFASRLRGTAPCGRAVDPWRTSADPAGPDGEGPGPGGPGPERARRDPQATIRRDGAGVGVNLNIHSSPSFVSTWLPPRPVRLPRFRGAPKRPLRTGVRASAPPATGRFGQLPCGCITEQTVALCHHEVEPHNLVRQRRTYWRTI